MDSDYSRAREYLESLDVKPTVSQFKSLFNDQLLRKKGPEWIRQGLIVGVPEAAQRRRRFTTKRRTVAITIFRRVPEAEYVQVTRRGKVDVVYFKDKRHQLHKRGRDGQFQRFTKVEKRRLKVNKPSPSHVKKLPER